MNCTECRITSAGTHELHCSFHPNNLDSEVKKLYGCWKSAEYDFMECDQCGRPSSRCKCETNYALVYVGYEGMKVLELGSKEFVLNKFHEYTKGITEFRKKYEYLKSVDYEREYPDEYYNSPYSDLKESKRLCIQGYIGDKVDCVCKDMGIGGRGRVLY